MLACDCRSGRIGYSAIAIVSPVVVPTVAVTVEVPAVAAIAYQRLVLERVNADV